MVTAARRTKRRAGCTHPDLATAPKRRAERRRGVQRSRLKGHEEDRMTTPLRIGIIICDRYRSCAGGKCFRAVREREGAFSAYADREVELVGFTSCGGCPGGNIEYAPEEMKKNGAEVIHLATGFVVGYPPCPHLEHFQRFIPEKYGIPVVVGTHPIPQKYFTTHTACGTWKSGALEAAIQPTLCDEATRLRYD